MFAASQGRADIAQLLVDGQADVNARCETVRPLKLVRSCLCSVGLVVLDRVRPLLVSAWCILLLSQKELVFLMACQICNCKCGLGRQP